ncbi:hypothetical protein DPMN_099588 [Dreissena polymorpha]|uniref:Uncharacterized protein n=1 Tax=Dreissena polymorpha TaxID=45954 RepID=A0A9D4LHJ5_DREPO|nr:hypothetical protein DPMN_099588 [Dreissena polymorpha]
MESRNNTLKIQEWRVETAHLGYKNGEKKPHIKDSRMEIGNCTFSKQEWREINHKLKIQEWRLETAHLGYKNEE